MTKGKEKISNGVVSQIMNNPVFSSTKLTIKIFHEWWDKITGDMTKQEVYTKHLNKRVFVDSNKEIDHDHYLAIMDAMEEYADSPLNERSKKIELLDEYSTWLTKNGYMDTDWKDEEPFAIDDFLGYKK